MCIFTSQKAEDGLNTLNEMQKEYYEGLQWQDNILNIQDLDR